MKSKVPQKCSRKAWDQNPADQLTAVTKGGRFPTISLLVLAPKDTARRRLHDDSPHDDSAGLRFVVSGDQVDRVSPEDSPPPPSEAFGGALTVTLLFSPCVFLAATEIVWHFFGLAGQPPPTASPGLSRHYRPPRPHFRTYRRSVPPCFRLPGIDLTHARLRPGL